MIEPHDHHRFRIIQGEIKPTQNQDIIVTPLIGYTSISKTPGKHLQSSGARDNQVEIRIEIFEPLRQPLNCFKCSLCSCLRCRTEGEF